MKTKDIRINEKLIRSYKPCIEGLTSFTEHYKDISIKTLITSKKISYEHKVWLLGHIVPPELLVLWAIDSSFAAYKYSDIRFDYYASGAADAAADAMYYVNNNTYYAISAAVYAANAAYFAAPYSSFTAAVYAVNAAYFSAPYNSVTAYYNAQKERLQSLLYFIENEGE